MDLPYWLGPGDDRPVREIDDEIAEELQLHLDLLEEEAERRGATPDEARQQAADRFGDFDQLVRRCRKEVQGDAPMLKRVQTGLLAVMTIAVVLLGVRDYVTSATTAAHMDQTTASLLSIHTALSEMRGALQQGDNGFEYQPLTAADAIFQPQPWPEADRLASADATRRPSPPSYAAASPHSSAPTILVRDERGEPIAGAKLRVVQQMATSSTSVNLTTNEEGECRVDGTRVGGSWPVKRIDAMAAGHVFASFEPSSSSRRGEFIELTLPAAVALEAVVTQANGDPAGRYTVTPASRTDLGDVTHSADGFPRSLSRQTDESGRVTIDWLRPGDIATVQIKERGANRTVETVEFTVPEDGSRAIAIRLPPGLEALGGGGGYGAGGFGGGGFGGGGFGGVVGATDASQPVAKRRPTSREVTGVVTDAAGEPIAGASVLVIHKSWSPGYRQDNYVAITNDEGRFVLDSLIDTSDRYGLNVAVVAPGHAIASEYRFEARPSGGRIKKLAFELVEAAPLLVKLVDAAGEPVVGGQITPSARTDAEGVEHLVYFQGSKTLWRSTDNAGLIEVDWFAPGDAAKVHVRDMGGEWRETTFEVPAEGGEVTLTVGA